MGNMFAQFSIVRHNLPNSKLNKSNKYMKT